jgi:hypothetical protein
MPRATSPRRPAQAGFTLVELMVAVTGGLFVSLAVFVLAKHSTGFYQSEARAGTATFSEVVGFSRLRADIARAGFLVTPNIVRDPAICSQPGLGGYPAALAQLAAIQIRQADASTLTQPLQDNGLAPDVLRLAGSYTSTDQFETTSIQDNGTNEVVYLRNNSPALARLGYDPNDSSGTQSINLLQQIFQAGRALRVLDLNGREQYATIVSVGGNANTPQILVGNSDPGFEYRSGNDTARCGFNNNGTGALANVVNIIEYSIGVPTTTSYAAAVANTQTTIPTDSGRTELLRVELDTSGNPIATTEEVVTEYAVDMRFGISVAQSIVNNSGVLDQQKLVTFPEGNSEVYTWGAAPSGVANGPQQIRSVRARLSVRSREADRRGDMASTSSTFVPGFYRMQLPGGGSTPYARVRTIQADIALRNQMGVMWQ